jgi:hypothetical protein
MLIVILYYNYISLYLVTIKITISLTLVHTILSIIALTTFIPLVEEGDDQGESTNAMN